MPTIRRYAAGKWHITTRQTNRYIARARQRIGVLLELDPAEQLATALGSYEMIFAKQMAGGDLRGARATMHDIVELLGLAAAKRSGFTGRDSSHPTSIYRGSPMRNSPCLRPFMRNWLPSRAELARERERRHAANLRGRLEALDHPDWPPWPPEADVDHHAWVRAHWTIEASDRFDVLRMMTGDLELARLHVLGQDLLDLDDDVEAIRSRIGADGHDVWEEDGVHDWRAWVAAHWRSDLAEALEHDLRFAATSLGWVGDHRERMRQQQREHVACKAGLLRLDLSEREMAPYLERRVCGIRGRYRLLGSVLEKRLGITARDINAP